MKRPNLLTHWTGKDICTDLRRLDEELRRRYLERLLSLLEHGFWMNPISENLRGWSADERPVGLGFQPRAVCFTELRLSRASKHAERYGLLGIVVDRTYVLDRWGGPVHYVRSNKNDAIVQNVHELHEWIVDNFIEPNVGKNVGLTKNPSHNLWNIQSMMKSMSRIGENDDFEYLDEREWRIPHSSTHGRESGLYVVTGKQRPEFLVPVEPTELKMLVVPDSEFRSLIISDERFIAWTAAYQPPILTFEDLENI